MVSKSRQQQQNSGGTQKETVTVKRKTTGLEKGPKESEKHSGTGLFTARGSLNCFKEKQEHQTSDWRGGRGGGIKKKKPNCTRQVKTQKISNIYFCSPLFH